MSEHEFELYLKLLGKFLRLRPGQQAEIADELRDHLEARLAELTSAGMSRETAIHRALDEFGDAACLADHFTSIVRERKRRLIMRCTMGSIAAAAAVLVMFNLFAPQAPNGVGPANSPALAQAEEKAKSEPPKTFPSLESEKDRAVRDKLAADLKDCEFLDTHLSDVLSFVSERLSVDIYAPQKEFETELTTPISLHLKHVQPSGRTVLELALRQAQLAYTVREGIIMIGRPESLTEIRVYNCADLNLPAREKLDEFGGMGGAFGGEPAKSDAPAAPPARVHQTGTEVLADIVPALIAPSDWLEAGGTVGHLEVVGSMLVVRATPSMHEEIELLLKQLASPKVVVK